MSVAPLSAAQLHEPIMPLARPPQVVLQPEQTIAETLDRIRASANASSIHYFYVVDDHDRLVGVVPVERDEIRDVPRAMMSEIKFTGQPRQQGGDWTAKIFAA